MRKPLWLSKELILAVHERLMAEFGGLAGLRDEGLLESALAKPENLLAYGKPDIFDLAACYAYGIVKDHPFVDGNKRMGFASAAVLLETNEYRLTAEEAGATAATLALAEGTLSEEGYAGWLTEQSERATTSSKEGRRKQGVKNRPLSRLRGDE